MKIYVMMHKPGDIVSNEIYTPIQVGAALGTDFGILRDDTGEHISEKNPYYSELTGLYWMWKNSCEDILGLCHYRRFFVKDGRFLEKEYIQETLDAYDIIVPETIFAPYKDIYTQYSIDHHKLHFDLCREYVKAVYPEYAKAFDLNMNNRAVTMCNMFITRRAILDKYCRWLFDILFHVEKVIQKEIDSYASDDQNRRVYGFLSERLFRAWLLNQPLKIREEQIVILY